MTKRCDPPGGLMVGSTARLEATLTEEDPVSDLAVPTDPATVTLSVRDPSGNISTPTPVRTMLGSYMADIALDIPGQWKFAWESTEPLAAAEGSFVVRRSTIR